MLFPFLDGFLTFSRAPITWILLLMNIFLFSQNSQLSRDLQIQMDVWYEDSSFLHTQGRLYKQYLGGRELAKVTDLSVLGRLAFRDSAFLNKFRSFPWQGDPVAIASWQEEVEDFLVLRAYTPSLLMGVSEERSDWLSFLSYQFYHEGFLHLFGNVALLLLVGGYLERKVSGLIVFSVYLLGGGVAAYLYAEIQGLSGAPLVGASGSVCALLGFLAVLEWRQETKLFYLVLPQKPYMGFVLFPTIYWVIWLLMLEDLAGVWSQSELFGSGVAHWVHLYGFLIGALLAVLFRWTFGSGSSNLSTHQPLPAS